MTSHDVKSIHCYGVMCTCETFVNISLAQMAKHFSLTFDDWSQSHIVTVASAPVFEDFHGTKGRLCEHKFMVVEENDRQRKRHGARCMKLHCTTGVLCKFEIIEKKVHKERPVVTKVKTEICSSHLRNSPPQSI